MKKAFFVCLLLLHALPIRAQEHPFLLTRNSDYPQLRSRAELSPWKEMKAQALEIASAVFYDRNLNGPRNKSERFVEVVSAGTLAYILDPDHATTYRDKVLTTLFELQDIRLSRTGGDWDSNVPVAAAVFNAVLALDVLYNDLSTTDRETVEQHIAAILPLLADEWHTSPYAANGIWALYRKDRAQIDHYKSLYRARIEEYLTEDGLFSGGTNYGHSRFAKPEREQKFMFMDVLAFTGEDDWYNDPKVIALYEWMFGQSLTLEPSNSALTFGDSRLFSSHYGMLNESPRAYNVHRFSEKAGRWAAWHVQGKTPSARLTTYLTTDRAMLPERPQLNRIYPDGGTWFFHQPEGGPVLGGALWNARKSESHTHKETNAIHLIAYGEHALINAGYNGWGTGTFGFTWEYINNTAVSGNTVLINKKDHVLKHGDGVTEGFMSDLVNYASGHSGGALPDGIHRRNFLFLSPADGTDGYWVLFDEIEASSAGATAQVALHAHSANITENQPMQSYTWRLDRTTGRNVHLTAYLATLPASSVIHDGLIADGSSGSFVGRYLYSSYSTDETGRKNIVTVLFPSNEEHPLPTITRLDGAGFTGAVVQQSDDVHDVMVESSGDTTLSWNGLSFKALAVWSRQDTYGAAPFFVRHGLTFRDEHGNGFEADQPVSVLLYAGTNCEIVEAKSGRIVSPGATVTLHHPCAGRIRLNGEEVSLEQIGPGSVRLFIPPGTHELSLNAVTVDREPVSDLPQAFMLLGNYPNPFNPSTTIRFDLPTAADVSITIFDLLGRSVLTIPAQHVEAGANQSITIQADHLRSGVYIYQIVAGNQVASGTMTLLK